MKEFTRGLIAGLSVAAVWAIGVALFFVGCGVTAGPAGTNGKDGKDGQPGETVQGPPGVDATPVIMVKLCPGENTYPSVFVEYAFCIQSKLYATYSANGGFSTYLPPGQYNSNAVGSSCTFTVAEGCQVTQ